MNGPGIRTENCAKTPSFRQWPLRHRGWQWRATIFSAGTSIWRLLVRLPRETDRTGQREARLLRPRLQPKPRTSQGSTPHDHDLRFQMGSRVRPRPGARSARALGPGGSRPALRDAPPGPGRSGQTGLSRAAALRAGADARGRRLRPLRIRSHRALYRRTERDAAAEGRGRPRPRDAMADRGTQFDRAVRHE